MATIDATILENEQTYSQLQEVLNRAFINNQILINNLKETSPIQI